MADFYPYSRQEAKQRGELDAWKDSCQANIVCARDIEKRIAAHGRDGRLEPDQAKPILSEWGFLRVQFVLANTLVGTGSLGFEADSLRWARRMFVPPDPANGDFRVKADRELLAQFVQQTHAEYLRTGLFGPEHCGTPGQNITGKVVILRPERLKEDCLSPQNMLWLALCGFGCDPNIGGYSRYSGWDVFATCLGGVKKTHWWNRLDFMGVLDEQYLPDWAAERLAELRGASQQQDAPAQEQEPDEGPVQGGMEMR